MPTLELTRKQVVEMLTAMLEHVKSGQYEHYGEERLDMEGFQKDFQVDLKILLGIS